MGWAVGYDTDWRRDIGYGVPAMCDHPACAVGIDRGLAYRCGWGLHGDEGCGLFFCPAHVGFDGCDRCAAGEEPFEPKPDLLEWVEHKLYDPSWRPWRVENPVEAAELQRLVDATNEASDRTAGILVTRGFVAAQQRQARGVWLRELVLIDGPRQARQEYEYARTLYQMWKDDGCPPDDEALH